jgi:hypothetical protein
MKRGKENKINVSNNYCIVSGTVDTKNPKSIYINMSAWGEPKLEGDVSYDRVISQINKQIKQKLYSKINKQQFIHDRILVDLDMRESGIQYGKRSFMNCEITLYQKNELSIDSDELNTELTNITKLIVDEILDSNEFFSFYKSKK